MTVIHPRSSLVPAGLCCAGAAAASLWVVTRDVPFMKSWYGPIGYYGMWVLFLVWIGALYGWISARHRGPRPDRKELLQAGFTCLLLTVISLSIPAFLKILSDEAYFTSISRSMFFDKRADFVTETKWAYDSVYAVGRQFPHKSILFPFFIHLMHLVTGYRAGNVFVLNTLTLFALLAMMYFILTRMGRVGRLAACAGLVMITAQPVVLMYARSGGYDLFFTALLVANFLILKAFLEAPSPAAFRALAVSLLVLATARPESSVFLIITLAFLAAAGKIRRSYWTDPWVILPLPWALAIIVWQRDLVAELWPGFFQTPPGVKAYSVGHFLNNSAVFFKSLVNFRFFYPFANVVNLIGAAFIAYCALFRWKDLAKLEPARRMLLFITAANVLAAWAIYNGLHLGGMHVRISARYYILFAVILSAFAVLALARTPSLGRRPFLILLFAVFMHGLYYPVAFDSPSLKVRSQTQSNRTAHEFLGKVPDSRFLVVTNQPKHFVVDNYAAISFRRANREAASLLEYFRTGLYSNIYVIQEIQISNMQPPPKMFLKPEYTLETVFEQKTGGGQFLRISRVVRPPHPGQAVQP